MSILLVEQNARAALQVADYGYVLETGDLALEGASSDLIANPHAGLIRRHIDDQPVKLLAKLNLA